jgi:uncharacterized membrane protein
LTEPDVTLTDYVLALECSVICWLLWRRAAKESPLKIWAIVFFAATGAAALSGGTVHGFFLDESQFGHRVLWPLTLLLLGVAALSAWIIGAHLLLHGRGVRAISIAASIVFVGYGVVVVFVSQNFAVAIANYLPACLFLLATLVVVSRRRPARPLVFGIAALVLTLVSGALQRARIGLHPDYFNHNALYHLLQAIALWLLFLCFLWICEQGTLETLRNDAKKAKISATR